MEYQIIMEEHPGALAREVNKAIAEGWTPLGGVCVTGSQFVQAMVRLQRPDRRLAHVFDDRQARPA